MKIFRNTIVLLWIATFGAISPALASDSFALVELFTSQGCSSCPPADVLFSQLSQQSKDSDSKVYFLSFHVDYWDYLGWKDPYSNPEFTKRQYQYTKALGDSSTYTPQMIINGRQAFIASDRSKAKRYIKIYQEIPAVNTITLHVGKRDAKGVVLSYECDRLGAGAVIHFALVETGLETQVNAGENKGLLIKNDYVVRQLVTIPVNSQGVVSLVFPSFDTKGKYEVVAYVQDQKDMRIYAAQRVVLE